MPDTKISDMVQAFSFAPGAVIPVVQGGNNVKVSASGIYLSNSVWPINYFINPGGHFYIYGGSPISLMFDINSTGQIQMHSPVGFIRIGYYPLNPAHWAASPPSNVGEALDRLALWTLTANPAIRP